MEHNDTWEPIPESEQELPEIPGESEEPDFFWQQEPAAGDAAVFERDPATEPESEPVYERTYTPQPVEFTVPKKRTGKSRGFGRKILCAVLAAALAIGSGAVAAGMVNRRWEERMEVHQTQVNTQIAQLQEQIQALEQKQTGAGVSGSPVASQGGLTPSQVYAMNVNSVVAISNQSTTNIWGQVSETASSGTGFIISQDGYIFSNYHVVEGARKLTVITYMGDEYEAKLVGFDKMNDVAILKVEASGLEAVTIGSSDSLIVGDQVVPSAIPWVS